jgi:hypothetical protein
MSGKACSSSSSAGLHLLFVLLLPISATTLAQEWHAPFQRKPSGPAVTAVEEEADEDGSEEDESDSDVAGKETSKHLGDRRRRGYIPRRPSFLFPAPSSFSSSLHPHFCMASKSSTQLLPRAVQPPALLVGLRSAEVVEHSRLRCSCSFGSKMMGALHVALRGPCACAQR